MRKGMAGRRFCVVASHRTLSLAALAVALCFRMVDALASEYPPSIDKVGDRSPEADAAESIELGRIRFLGIRGYSVSVPGADSEKCRVDRHLVDAIQGTSDYYPAGKDPNLRAVAVEYALRYNRSMLEAFKLRYPDSCLARNSSENRRSSHP